MRVFLDIETRALADEVGGWGELRRGAGGISIIVTLEDPDNGMAVWDEYSLPELAEYLVRADEVITWNGFHFDIPVIENMLGRSLALNNHRDLKMELKARSLEEAGQRYCGRGKTADGTDAVRFLREGRIAELVNYCRDDVELLRDIYYATNGLDLGLES